VPSKKQAGVVGRQGWVSPEEFRTFVESHLGHPADVQIGSSKARSGNLESVVGDVVTIQWMVRSGDVLASTYGESIGTESVPVKTIRFISMNYSDEICGQRIA
jgi:hypothetical protein